MNDTGCVAIVILIIMLLTYCPSPGLAGQIIAKHLVIIDPAHGGSDKGVKVSEKRYEKDFTLKIALALQKELQSANNFLVRLTRLSDVDMSIAQRVSAVRNAKADMFFSLHINAGFGKNAAGYEVYFPGFQTAQVKNDGAADILTDMAKNKYLNDSVALAQSVMGNMQQVFSRKGRGLRDAPVLVLEGLSLPAVVVEIGFATNDDDNSTLTKEKGQQAIAQALGRSIKEYFH